MNKHTLFTKVHDYYADLAAKLGTARHEISMTYLSFDKGEWATRISDVLCSKALSGVQVRLMVDEFGQLLDEPRHAIQNIGLFRRLRSHGVQVNIYRPASPLNIKNRLHCKIAAIDDHTVFMGGSNIGDYYTAWTDTNMRVDGDFGRTFHNVYDFLLAHSQGEDAKARSFETGNLPAGTDRLFLTLPRQRQDIRNALMRLIRNAGKAIFIRTWYFLPDDEMLEALCDKARNGTQVNILLSHETRIRPVDFANYIHVHKLASAGGNVYRYMGKYMHSKAAWNDNGDVVLGSANLDPHSMRNNFESCLQIHDPTLAWELRRDFYGDIKNSLPQTPETFMRRSLADKVLTYTCNLASPWM